MSRLFLFSAMLIVSCSIEVSPESMHTQSHKKVHIHEYPFFPEANSFHVSLWTPLVTGLNSVGVVVVSLALLPSETNQRELWCGSLYKLSPFFNDMIIIVYNRSACPYRQRIRVIHSFILMDYIPILKMTCLQLLYIWSEVKQMNANSDNTLILSSWFVWGE